MTDSRATARRQTRPAPAFDEDGIGEPAGSPEDETVAVGEHAIGIRQLASEFGVSFRTLRFYETRGLLAPQRTGSKRLYSQSDRERLRAILLAKQFGFTLLEAMTLIPLFREARYDGNKLKSLRGRLAAQEAALVEQGREIAVALTLIRKTLGALDDG